MDKRKIRIETRSGKTIERMADVTDWIDTHGRQRSTATCGRATYRVIRHDAFGAVFMAFGVVRDSIRAALRTDFHDL